MQSLIQLISLKDWRENHFGELVLLITTSPKLYSSFQELTMSLEWCDMLSGATLFGVILVLVIVVSFAFLLKRKPSFSFRGLPAETIKLETKSKKSGDGTKKVSGKCPNYFGYLRTIPKNTRIPNECVTCTKIVECQGLNAFREEDTKKVTETAQNLKGLEKTLVKVESQRIAEGRQVTTSPKKNPREMPSGCPHFFGYLRNMPKNTLIPDDCLGCPKIVECMYHVVLE